jgi:hypothetical protein
MNYLDYYQPTESRASGERRPISFFIDIGGKNRPFSTGGYTDTRGFSPDFPRDSSLSGSYDDLDVDNIVFRPDSFLGGPTQARRRTDVENLSRSNYNREQGPGSSSSRPAYPTNARDKVQEDTKFLKKALGNRKDRREGGSPKGNRK